MRYRRCGTVGSVAFCPNRSNPTPGALTTDALDDVGLPR